MELSEEEIIKLYNLFRNMSLLDMNLAAYTDSPLGDTDLIEFQRKVKQYIESKGPEWMRGKNIRKWW